MLQSERRSTNRHPSTSRPNLGLLIPTKRLTSEFVSPEGALNADALLLNLSNKRKDHSSSTESLLVRSFSYDVPRLCSLAFSFSSSCVDPATLTGQQQPWSCDTRTPKGAADQNMVFRLKPPASHKDEPLATEPAFHVLLHLKQGPLGPRMNARKPPCTDSQHPPR